MSQAKTDLKPIDTPIYGYWQALYLSFFSKRLYVDVGKRWRGVCFFYLLLVVALLSIPLAYRVSVNFDKQFQEAIVQPLSQLPPLYVQKGLISIDKPVPYFIKNDKGQVVLIIDTSGVIKDFTPTYPELSILITKDSIIYKMPAPNLLNMPNPPKNFSQPIVQRLEPSVNSYFEGTKFIAEPNVGRLKLVSQIMIYPIVTLLFFSIFIVMFPVLAFIGQVFSYVFFTFQISYFQALRLLVVAATPMMLALFLYLYINIFFLYIGVPIILILVIYYSFALFALRAESRQIVV
ncbi:MAG: DUF1189 family protein [Legionella sp.]